MSPCNMSPSMSMMGGQRSSPQRANLGSCAGADRMNSWVQRSLAPESQSGSHVVLPSLCLRRQVLTNGKDRNVPAQPPLKRHPGPTTHAGACSDKGTRFRKYQIVRKLLWF